MKNSLVGINKIIQYHLIVVTILSYLESVIWMSVQRCVKIFDTVCILFYA
jgi:hypothetical protein